MANFLPGGKLGSCGINFALTKSFKSLGKPLMGTQSWRAWLSAAKSAGGEGAVATISGGAIETGAGGVNGTATAGVFTGEFPPEAGLDSCFLQATREMSVRTASSVLVCIGSIPFRSCKRWSKADEESKQSRAILSIRRLAE